MLHIALIVECLIFLSASTMPQLKSVSDSSFASWLFFYSKLQTPEVLNHAITSTISRTVITHGSTQLMVLSMLIFGGPTLHYFALALTIGILFGIYSSVFVAAAIAMWLGVKREDLVKPQKKKDGEVVDLP